MSGILKEDERGVEIMCREMEIMRNQAHEEGIEKGRIMQLIKQVCVKCRNFLPQRKLQMILLSKTFL